jgi:uncharacterized protein YutE (UPF0331/DUF86 family)
LVEADVVFSRLEVLRTNLRRLRRTLDAGRHALLASEDEQLKVERSLQLALQAVLDIATHVIASEGLERPRGYEEVLRILGSSGRIDAELAERLSGVAGMRNILVHDYLVVDHGRLFDDVTSGIADLEEYARAVAALLKRG